MLHAINDIRSSVSKGTTTTMKVVQYFMDYAASNPDAKIIYRSSDMILQSNSDAAYLVAPEALSRAAGYHFLGSRDHQQILKTLQITFQNTTSGPITVASAISIYFSRVRVPLFWKGVLEY